MQRRAAAIDSEWRRPNGAKRPRPVVGRGWLSGCLVTLVSVLAALPGLAQADVFELRNGERIEGAVIRESSTFISVKTSSGEVVTLDVGQIVRREKAQSEYDEYQARRDKLGAKDLEGHLQLAQWCVDRSLFQESLFHLRMVLTADPNHEEARRRLGYVRIHGRWYIEGSPEAEAAQTGNSDRFTGPPIELPESFSGENTNGAKPKTKSPIYGGSGERVRFELSESLGGAEPDYPVANYELQNFLRGLDQPMALVAQDATEAAFVMKLRLDVRFQRTHSFYGRIPISHIFSCEASLEFLDADGKSVCSIGKVSMSFSGSARRDKAEIAKAGHYYLMKTLVSRLSQLPYFVKRGAKPIAAPEW